MRPRKIDAHRSKDNPAIYYLSTGSGRNRLSARLEKIAPSEWRLLGLHRLLPTKKEAIDYWRQRLLMNPYRIAADEAPRARRDRQRATQEWLSNAPCWVKRATLAKAAAYQQYREVLRSEAIIAERQHRNPHLYRPPLGVLPVLGRDNRVYLANP